MILRHEGQFIARCDNKECEQTLYTGIEELRAYETVFKAYQKRRLGRDNSN
jgi:hypothetical protein